MAKRTPYSRRTALLAGVAIVAALAYAKPGDVEGDVWVYPPVHRNMQAFKLGDTATDGAITLVEGSRIDVKIRGSWAQPFLTFNGIEAPLQFDGNNYHLDVVPDTAGALELRAGLFYKRRWLLDVANDESPTVQFTATPAANPQNLLRIPFEVSDDIRVSRVTLEFRALDDDDAPLEQYIFPGADTAGQVVRNTQYLNLLRHPMAGESVVGRLIAHDDLGQVATSASMRFKLPSVRFSHDPARTLSTIRHRLMAAPDDKQIGLIMLSQLTDEMEKKSAEVTLYSLIQSAYFRLQWAENEDDVRTIADYLWDVALYANEDMKIIGARDAVSAVQDLDSLLHTPALKYRVPAAYRTLLNAVRALGDVGLQADSNVITTNPDQLNALRLMEDIARFIDLGQNDRARHSLAELIPHIERLGQ